MRSSIFTAAASALAALTGASATAATPVAVANYITFDNTAAQVYDSGDVLTLASPERDSLITQVIGYNPSTSGNDGPEVTTASLASPLQGGQVLAVDPGTANDEGVWVELSNGFPIEDVTVEAMFFTSDINPAGRVAGIGIQYILSTEIPGPSAQFFQGQLRILGNGGPVGRPGDSEHLEWNAGSPPPGGPEVRVVTTSTLNINSWYHVAGVLDYNDADPANSTMELFIAEGRAIDVNTDSQGTVAIDLDDASVTTSWGPPFSPGATGSPNTDVLNRYFIGSSPNNSINGSDNRGLVGEIDAVCVTAQAGEVYLPNSPPVPPVTAIGDWGIYR